ncbi:hypothetical protein E2C01_030311 [Portunus trituberculatus]|uniref:Uncharacterized protein n=1 Tax=Portunus trituberculatus TaxID=210409 RepID=A0A5B7EWZ4_PORTR|nr:hypothetical protein [Portunus trituberculatus]
MQRAPPAPQKDTVKDRKQHATPPEGVWVMLQCRRLNNKDHLDSPYSTRPCPPCVTPASRHATQRLVQ